MIIGFMGKGGSGKTTLSTRFIQAIQPLSKHLLAIDADHNMDLLFNLGIREPFPYLGEARPDLEQYLDTKETTINQIIKATSKRFQLSPPDTFTAKYTKSVKNRLSVMAIGPHTDQVMHGMSCSHVLLTPLKAYLPLMELKEDEHIMIDQVAGMDAVGTGIVTGCDFTFIVAEATAHGIKTAKQIAEHLEFYKAPYSFVLNKSQGVQSEQLAINELGFLPPHRFHIMVECLDPNTPTTEEDRKTCIDMLSVASDHRKQQGDQRLERSLAKIEKSEAYKKAGH